MSESLRDQLSAAFEQVENTAIEGDGEGVVHDTTIPVPAEPEPLASASKISEAPKGDDRPRDPKTGQFIEKSEPAAAPKKDASPSRSSSEANRAPAPAAARARPPRPSSWKKDYQAHWDKLTAGEQLSPEEATALAEYMNTRETDFQHGVATYKREWETAKPLMEAMTPFMPLLQQSQIPPAVWITNLGRAHQALAMGSPHQKLQMFARIAQDYGVPLAALTDQTAQQQYLSQPAPQQFQQSALPPGVLTRDEADRLFQERFAAMQAEQEVGKIISDREHYPHMDAVRETMAQLLEAGLAEDLPGAYDAALRHPRHSELWQAHQEQERAARDEEARRAEAERVAKARGRAVSTRSATPSATPATKPEGLRATLESAFDAHSGGGRV